MAESTGVRNLPTRRSTGGTETLQTAMRVSAPAPKQRQTKQIDWFDADAQAQAILDEEARAIAEHEESERLWAVINDDLQAQQEAQQEALAEEQRLAELEAESERLWELDTASSKGMRRGVKVTLALALTGFIVVVGTWVFAGSNIKVNDPVPASTSTGGFSIDPDLIQPQDGVQDGSEALNG